MRSRFGARRQHADSTCAMPRTPKCPKPRRHPDGAALATSGGMKKPTAPKLALRTQTVRQLTQDALAGVAGGFIMKDTIIIRTSGIVAGPTDLA
jgi:hypothetical protein